MSKFTLRKLYLYLIMIGAYCIMFGLIFGMLFVGSGMRIEVANIVALSLIFLSVAADHFIYSKIEAYIVMGIKILLGILGLIVLYFFFIRNGQFAKIACWSVLYFDFMILIIVIPLLLGIKRVKRVNYNNSYEVVQERDFFDDKNEYYKETPYDYEIRVAEYLRSIGYLQVDTTPKSGDYGADVIATSPNGVRMCVQCKQYSEGNNVGVKAVQEIYAAKDYYNCKLAYIFTTSSYTEQARRLADRLGVVLLEYK